MKTKKKAIIVDLDGTLCDIKHRVHFVEQEPKDWRSFHTSLVKDKLNFWCAEIIEDKLARNYGIILLTGRPEKFIEETKSWLQENNIQYDYLYMRPRENRQEDFLVKKDIYLNKIKPTYDVEFILEDRNSVVAMWRELGLVCLQCAEGDF